MKSFILLIFILSSHYILSAELDISPKQFTNFKQIVEKIISANRNAEKMEDGIIRRVNEGIEVSFLFNNKFDYQEFVKQKAFSTEEGKLKYTMNENEVKLSNAFSNLIREIHKESPSTIKIHVSGDTQRIDDISAVKLVILYNPFDKAEQRTISRKDPSGCIIL